MDRLLQQFETTVTDQEGDVYSIHLYGRSRPGDTWQAWLVFERQRDGRQFSTPVETTQPSSEAVLYWVTGLTGTYLDGALMRALHPPQVSEETVRRPARDASTHDEELNLVERGVLSLFEKERGRQILVQNLFDELPYSHADVTRAMEHLEEERRIVERRTEEGNDWLFLRE